MAKKTEGVTEKLLECAKQEFLEKGYEKASLREIAKKANSSTGAIRIRYPDKNALFSALVEPITSNLLKMYDDGNTEGVEKLDYGNPKEMWEVSKSVNTQIVDCIYSDIDIYRLLVNCSVGSSYENFFDKLVEIDQTQTIEFLNMLKSQGYACKDITEQEIHMIISAQSYATLEIVRHNTTKKEALKQLDSLSDFFQCGWNKIFGF